MKIKLLTNLGNEKSTYLNAAVLLKAPRVRIKTLFILDTGSPQTIIGYSDARRLQIPFNNNPTEEIISIGGRKYHACSYDKLSAVFITEEGKLFEEQLGEVKLVKPTSPKEIEEVDRIPTIFGTDFLKKNKYKLFCDMSKDEAYIEKEDN